MRVKELFPLANEHLPFEFWAIERLPPTAGCYCLTNASMEVLYVGQAKSLRRRLREHFFANKRTLLTRFGRVSQVYWKRALLAELNPLERGWIETIRLIDGGLPPLNSIGAPT